jgi:hypothetical protein
LDRYLLMGLDQALLSALSLFVNLLLIHRGTKPEFALFSMVFSVVLLTQGVQNAAICTPMMVFANRVGAAQFPSLLSHLRRVNTLGALVASLVCGGGALLVVREPLLGATKLAVGTAVAILGVWFREQRRVTQLREGEFRRLVLGDGLVSLLVVLPLGLLSASRSLTAADALIALGLANLAVSISEIAPRPMVSQPSRSVIGDWMTQARWSVSGATVAWLQTSSYPLLVAMAMGTAAAADVAAARLFIAPGLLLLAAWGRLGLLQAADSIRADGPGGLKRFTVEQAVVVSLGAFAYCALVLVALSLGADRLLGHAYRNPILVSCWLLVGLLTAIRSVAGVALQAATAFSLLMRWGLVSALVSCASVLTLGWLLGAYGSVLGLALGETLQCGGCFWLLFRRRSGGLIQFA